jgi:hypothetical protein
MPADAARRHTVKISFSAYQVTVGSDAPEVLEGLAATFRQMLARRPARTVERLEVRRNGGGYLLPTGRQAPLGETLGDLRHQVISPLIRARPDLLWFHAGAAACRGGAVMVLGPSGHGKSTLVAGLCAGGWSYLSDEVVPLDPRSDRAMPFPLALEMREDPGEEVSPEALPRLRKTRVELPADRFGRVPVPVAYLVFPAFNRASPGRLTVCPPSQAVLELLRNCLNFADHREAAMRYLCGLVERLPAYRLAFGHGGPAAELIARAAEDRLPV